jgi:transcriptional regulator with XRE-family HTH domain
MSELKRHMINDALRLSRLYMGYSHAELAIALDISQSMISEIERGSKNVSMDLLQKYSDGLGIRMSRLMLFAEALEEEPIRKRGKLLIAGKALKMLEAFAPKDLSREPS